MFETIRLWYQRIYDWLWPPKLDLVPLNPRIAIRDDEDLRKLNLIINYGKKDE